MHRFCMGLQPVQLQRVVRVASSMSSIALKGLWSHTEPDFFPLAGLFECGFSTCVGVGHGRLPVPTPLLWLAVQCGQTDM